MEYEIKQVARRIRELREILEIPVEEMAKVTDCSVAEYTECEKGSADFTFTFLYKCAKRFGVDISELITGEVPKLSFYTITRAGEGMPIERRAEFKYQHLGFRLKDKPAECFLVTAKFDPAAQNGPIHLSTHKGHEFDFILKGSLKVQLDEHTEILNENDSIFYNSGHGHGMVAINGKDCEFLAIVMEE